MDRGHRHECFWPVICLAVLAWIGPAHAQKRWPDERAAGPFVCHADFSLQGQDGMLDEMARLQVDLARWLDVRPPREPIHLFLFQHKTTYRQYIRHYFPEVPDRRALYIKERGPGMVFAYRNDDFELDLRHESVHALLHAALPLVPLWLDEGLAEYFEVRSEARANGHPHLAKIKWGARLYQVPSIERLESIRELREMGQKEYRHAWAWVHFMLHGNSEAHDELIRFLGDIQAHTPPGTLSERLSRRIPDLERRFVRHFLTFPGQAGSAFSG